MLLEIQIGHHSRMTIYKVSDRSNSTMITNMIKIPFPLMSENNIFKIRSLNEGLKSGGPRFSQYKLYLKELLST